MSSYDSFALFYDSVVANPSKKALWLRQLIQKHRPGAKNILELACGTGGILGILANDYEVVGLDNSSEMLKVAHEKLPNVELVLADMSDFKLDQKFDVILCIYDSINHLLRFSDWESMFKKASEHLRPGGLFIFDMNTVDFLKRLNTSAPSVSNFGTNSMRITARPNGLAITTLGIEVSVHKPDGSTEIHKTDIPETSFSIPTVQAALEKHFKVLERLDERHYSEGPDYDNKVFFVCRQKLS